MFMEFLNKKMNYLKIILAVLLLLCLLDMPYGFYILIRYVATLVILYVMIKLSMSAFIAALVGFLSSKFAAFLQKPIHEHITRRVLQE